MDKQISWLEEHGFQHGKHWYQQKKNGRIVVLMAESMPPEPDFKPNLKALGQKARKSQTPSSENLPSSRQVSTAVS